MRAARRDRNKESYWRRMAGEQAQSGLTIRAWCGRHNLSEASFYWWRRQLARRDAESRETRSCDAREPKFVPVRVTAEPPAMGAHDLSAGDGSPSRMEIVLPGARVVRLVGAVDRLALTDVLAVLTSMTALDAETATC